MNDSTAACGGVIGEGRGGAGDFEDDVKVFEVMNVASADSDTPDFQEHFTGGGLGFGAGFPAMDLRGRAVRMRP